MDESVYLLRALSYEERILSHDNIDIKIIIDKYPGKVLSRISEYNDKTLYETINHIIENEDLELLENLVNICINIMTYFDTALKVGNIDIIKFFIGINKYNTINDWFLKALKVGNLEIIKLFMDRGINVNGNGNYILPIMDAIGYGNFEVVKFLVDNGALINYTYHNPFYGKCDVTTYIIKFGTLEMLTYFIEKGIKFDPNEIFVLAILSKKLDMVKYLFKNYDIKFDVENLGIRTIFNIVGGDDEILEFIVKNIGGYENMIDICGKFFILGANNTKDSNLNEIVMDFVGSFNKIEFEDKNFINIVVEQFDKIKDKNIIISNLIRYWSILKFD